MHYLNSKRFLNAVNEIPVNPVSVIIAISFNRVTPKISDVPSLFVMNFILADEFGSEKGYPLASVGGGGIGGGGIT